MKDYRVREEQNQIPVSFLSACSKSLPALTPVKMQPSPHSRTLRKKLSKYTYYSLLEHFNTSSQHGHLHDETVKAREKDSTGVTNRSRGQGLKIL